MLATVALTLLALTLARESSGEDGRADGTAARDRLDGSSWVVDVDGSVPEGAGGASPSATFEAGRMSGSTGCNRYTGAYVVTGDALELGPLAVTRMACPPPADEVERLFLQALSRVARWRTEGEELVLTDGAGADVLRLRRALAEARPPVADEPSSPA